AIFEAGIGGRLDASAVLQPPVVALTSVSLDHVELLGDDPASILREKLGIAPPGAAVVSARLGDELEEVARELWPGIELVDSRDRGVLERNAALAGAIVVVATTAWHGHTTEAASLAAALDGLPVQVVDAPAEATRLAFT